MTVAVGKLDRSVIRVRAREGCIADDVPAHCLKTARIIWQAKEMHNVWVNVHLFAQSTCRTCACVGGYSCITTSVLG